jgi:hypothetical protein
MRDDKRRQARRCLVRGLGGRHDQALQVCLTA